MAGCRNGVPEQRWLLSGARPGRGSRGFALRASRIGRKIRTPGILSFLLLWRVRPENGFMVGEAGEDSGAAPEATARTGRRSRACRGGGGIAPRHLRVEFCLSGRAPPDVGQHCNSFANRRRNEEFSAAQPGAAHLVFPAVYDRNPT